MIWTVLGVTGGLALFAASVLLGTRLAPRDPGEPPDIPGDGTSGEAPDAR